MTRDNKSNMDCKDTKIPMTRNTGMHSQTKQQDFVSYSLQIVQLGYWTHSIRRGKQMLVFQRQQYRLHNTILKYSTYDNILFKYLTVTKHKAKLSRTTPNRTLLNPYIYNIHNI